MRVDPSTIYDWVRAFAPLYEDAARPFRRAIGSSWSVDETYTKVAGKPAYAYRAIDGHGQVVDVYVSLHRATADAAAFFRRAIEATGGEQPPATRSAHCFASSDAASPVAAQLRRAKEHHGGIDTPRGGYGARCAARAAE